MDDEEGCQYSMLPVSIFSGEELVGVLRGRGRI